MSEVKVWDGAGFVVPADVKVWDGTAYTTPEVYVWDASAEEFVKVWPVAAAALDRQRMVKNGNFQNNADPVPDWVSDDTYPATVLDHKLVVSGGGDAYITANIVIGNFINFGRTVQLFHNGTNIGQATVSRDGIVYLGPYSRTVADGDTIHLVTTGNNYAGSGAILGGSSYIDVDPADHPIPEFVDAVSSSASASTLTVNITTTTAAMLIIATANGSSSSTSVTVNGTDATGRSDGVNMSVYAVPVSAGTHSVAMSGGALNKAIIVAAYTGVSNVGTFTHTSGSGTGPSVSPDGSGTRAVAVFQSSNILGATASGTSTIRVTQNHPTFQHRMLLADSPTSPVTVAQTTSSWYAAGVWLS